jgi:signal transduction histidine kinase
MLAAAVLETQAALASEKNIRLQDQLPTDLPMAWADVDLIERVLQNLIGNGIKFTPPGGTVCLKATLVDQPGLQTLQVTVSDTGPGIPAKIRKRLFQKFVTGSHPGHGNGLGLAFCKLALEAHDQHIWVESSSSTGTTFAFSLATAASGLGQA